MSAWPLMRLDDCCEIVSGATPSTSERTFWDGGEICWATPKDLSELQGAIISHTPRKITAAGLASCGASILPAGSVLFSSRAPIGHVAITAVPMATNQGFKSMVPVRGLLRADYLYHWLRSHRSYLEGLGNGATFKEVSKAVVSRVMLPIPPLSEQRRIAAILDQADALRATRRAALRAYCELAHVLFLDMFGDPLSNPKGWRKVPIGELGSVITGNTPSRQVAEYYGDGIEWIKSDNINTGAYYATRASEQLSPSGQLVARVAPNRSILVTCIAGSPGSIGNTAMLDREAAFNQQINAIVPENCNAHFLYAQLRVGKRMVQEMSTEGMKGLVSKSRFEQIKVIVPPASMQVTFEKLILAVESMQRASGTALQAADKLVASLEYSAFQGKI